MPSENVADLNEVDPTQKGPLLVHARQSVDGHRDGISESRNIMGVEVALKDVCIREVGLLKLPNRRDDNSTNTNQMKFLAQTVDSPSTTITHMDQQFYFWECILSS